MLDRKVLRDLARLWAQGLAVALVMACGVATIIVGLGAYRSLDGTRAAFYERNRFGSVFAQAVRAPLRLEDRLRAISGVSAAALRISKPIILDMKGMREPASGLVVSIPDRPEEMGVNRLYLRSGRLPDPKRPDEVAVLSGFAKAHGLRQGDAFHAILGGVRRRLVVAGIVLTPEAIYTLGPGDMVPDTRRFGIMFAPRRSLEGTFDMAGAFNDLVLVTLRGADLRAVIQAVDDILEPYGGRGAYDREDHLSHAFLDAELQQLQAMATIIPPIFLGVSAFLVNMILSRLLALEREQIGLLKALGRSNLSIAMHYSKLVIAISMVGIAIGVLAGLWLGRGLTRIYAGFFSFPYLLFDRSLDLYVIAGAITLTAGLLGAAKAISSVVSLPPAVAMRPPSPPVYRSFLGGRLSRIGFLSKLTVMALRNIARRPVRSGLTTFGIALSTGLLVAATFSHASLDFMIETIFFRAERQDATITFAQDMSRNARFDVLRLPGVMRAEPFRRVPVTLRAGHRSQKISLASARPRDDLSRVLDAQMRPMDVPSNGLVVSDRVASLLAVEPGDAVEVELREEGGRTERVTVAGLSQTYVGMTATMDAAALDRLMRDGLRISGARLAVDPARLPQLYDAVKTSPVVVSLALQGLSRENLRDTIEQNISTQMGIYIGLAVIIAFGVVYNSARIQLSERARELASLRIFGFTRREVSNVLFVELGLQVALAQPVGWAVGAGLAWAIVQGFASDQFRIPLILEPPIFARATLISLAAAAVSALVVWQRVRRLDLIRVLKTRE